MDIKSNNFISKISVNNKRDRVNLGIEVLRMILCFWVLTFHCAGNKYKKNYKILKTFYHVPTFMIISFYLSNKLFSFPNIIKIKQRIARLLFPYLLIPIIQLLILILFFNYKITVKLFVNKILIDLLLQYITGYRTYVHLWFIQILIFLTFFFLIIIFIFKKKFFFIIQFIQITAYFFQYNEMNYNIFNRYKPHLRATSHIIEMTPIAISGIILAKIEILKNLTNHRIKVIFFCFMILFLLYNYNIFGDFKGFPYSGIKNNIAGVCLFISFSLIPFENIKKILFFKIIRQLSSYTGGIYYFHGIIRLFIQRLSFITYKFFFNCFIIYIVSYIICVVGTKIFNKSIFKYLFN